MKKFAIASLVFLLPAVTFAQSLNTPTTTYITSFLQQLETIIAYVVPILFSIAFIIFIYGVIVYVIAGSAEKKEGASKIMIYGIIGLAVMASVWGLVKVLQNIFGISGQTSVQLPCIPSYNGTSNGTTGC